MASKTNTKPKGGAPVPAKPKNQQVAKSNVDVSALMEQDAGMGVSTDIADNIVPLIYIVQSQSPVALKQKPEYIRGAEAGNLWPRGEKQVWDAEGEGVECVPVHFDKCWIEWRPARGGFVARHKEKPADAVQKALDPQKPDRLSWVLPSGNIVQESREHVVLILGRYDDPMPFVMPFTGSNHTASRAWMGLMNRKRTPKGNKAPSFAYKYLIKTVAKSNDDGDWYGYSIEDTDERVEPDVYLAAREIAQGFTSGKLRAGDHDGSAGGEGSDDGVI